MKNLQAHGKLWLLVLKHPPNSKCLQTFGPKMPRWQLSLWFLFLDMLQILHDVCGNHFGKLWPLLAKHAYIPPIPHQQNVTKCLTQKCPYDKYLCDCISYAADILWGRLKTLGKLWPLLAKHAYIPPNLQPSNVTDPTFHLQCVSWGKLRGGGGEKGEGDMFGVLATSYTGGGPVQPGTVYWLSPCITQQNGSNFPPLSTSCSVL